MDLSGAHIEGYVPEDGDTAEAFGNVFDLQHGWLFQVLGGVFACD